tara:strand:- start:254 stop:481 length:228 start_codon:yes stop_codon:yes gene_type:complete
MTFNSVGALLFSIDHEHEDTRTITPTEIRIAIARRLAMVDDDELNELVGFEAPINQEFLNYIWLKKKGKKENNNG